jgi:hypothetical protein
VALGGLRQTHKSVQESFVASTVYELVQHPLFGFLKDYDAENVFSEASLRAIVDLRKLNHAMPAADSSALVVLCKVTSRRSGGLPNLRVNSLCYIFEACFVMTLSDLHTLSQRFAVYVVSLNPGNDRAVCTFVAEYIMAGDLILDFETFYCLKRNETSLSYLS